MKRVVTFYFKAVFKNQDLFAPGFRLFKNRLTAFILGPLFGSDQINTFPTRF
jgi:hypothetical protein